MTDTPTVPRNQGDREPGSPLVVSPELADQLLARAEAGGVELLGPGGLLSQVTKAVLERALGEEMTAHLGYEKHDPAGRGSGNSRNGTTSKTLLTDVGAVDLAVPRDRAGSSSRRSCGGARPGWRGSARDRCRRAGRVQLDRLAEVSRYPAGCVEAHGRIANQLCQVRLKVLELGGSDLPLPLIAQLVEDRLTLAQHLEAERGDLKEHAAGVAGVGVAGHVSAFLQHRDGFRRCLLGDRQPAAEF
jgi:hypothetical protein